MICFRCDNTEFKEENSEIEQEFGGKVISVQSPASFCTMCGWRTLTTDQADLLFKRTLNAFMSGKGMEFGHPKPIVGARYRSKPTGAIATLKRIKPDGSGLVMKHATKESEQSWKTFFTYWKPTP